MLNIIGRFTFFVFKIAHLTDLQMKTVKTHRFFF